MGITEIERDETMPLIEQIREDTDKYSQKDEPLDFVPVGMALGLTRKRAEKIHNELIERIDRAGGLY